jgi:hypothetical protein
MTNVVRLDEHRPHTVKYVTCMNCAHDWVAVAPVGVTSLECSECGAMEGEQVNHHDIEWFKRYMSPKFSKKQQQKRTLVLLNAKRMGL